MALRFLLSCLGLLAFAPVSGAQTSGEILKLSNGTELRFGLAAPKAIGKNQPVPLVIALHFGYSGTRPSPGYGQEFLALLVEPALRKLEAVMAAPDCPDRNWTSEKSEQAVMELIAHLESRFPVDRSKVVVTGFSLGGFGTWYMAARHPEVFCAAIPVAGRPQPELIDKIDHLSLFVIHSRKDTVVPIGPTEAAVAALKKRGVPVEFMVIAGLSHYETPAYVEYLARAVPWLKRIWEKGP